MDVDGENSHGRSKRRKGSSKRKLLVNQRVELKSVEEGFQGSWHPGTVVRCERQKRHVKYDNILEDDGSKYLVDVVRVSAILDGLGSSSDCSNECGFIRPLPPPLAFGERDLPFGLCVDVNYEEAWWEGVIFDHCNGTKERSVLFPDLGDEMKVGIHHMRLTQDWDEVTENWESRGKWVFLEMVEECEKESVVAVSFKQIWYDVRATKEFDDNIKHWTCNVKELWRDLVKEVIGNYYVLTLEQVFPALNLPEDFFKETPESVEPTDSIPLQEEYDKDPLVDGASEKEIILQQEPASPVQEIMPEAGEVMPGASCCGKKRKRGRSASIYWEPLVLTNVEFCPDVINEYIHGCGSKTVRELLKTKVRKHLAYLGWKIEWAEDKYFPGRGRYRYKSPDDAQEQKVYTSIIQVLTHMQMESNMNTVQPQIDHNRMHSTNDTNLSHLLSDLPPNDQDVDVCPPPKRKPSNVKVVVEPEFCPQAVVKYYLNASNKHWVDRGKWRLKAKKHLLAEGWTFDYPTKKRKTTLYISPGNKWLGLLRGACRIHIKEKISEWTNSGMIPLNVPAINESGEGHIDSENLLKILSQTLEKESELLTASPASRSTENRNHRCTRNSKASMPKSHRKGLSTRVLWSRKRVQKVSAPSPSHQRPRNVSSWLIDNSVVMSRCKVYCWAEGGRNSNVVEGRITYDGIKCSCCLKIYGLGGFVNHAGGSSDCRPSASIFLKDGKPLIVGANNLTWTLVKFINSESCDVGSTKNDLLAEKYSKLSVALSVMHECFEPLKNPFTSKDIIDDKVAEVPLVGTRIQYRRLGMCRILMGELEKRLTQLGVERLVLPAVSGVLETWTNSFGFAKMTNFERSQFLDYAFLDFQETIMCQKLLKRSSSPESVLTRGFDLTHFVDSLVLAIKEITFSLTSLLDSAMALRCSQNSCGLLALFLSLLVLVVSLQCQVASSAVLLSMKHKHNHVNNQRPMVQKTNQSICSLFEGAWVRDETEGYPLYQSSSCPIIDPEFNCQMYGRPDSDYLKYRWKPVDCELPRAPYLVDVDVIQGKRILRLEKVDENGDAWRGADVLSFNTGHWWSHQGSLQGTAMVKLPQSVAQHTLEHTLSR
ncbi:hypothetical protein JHK84_040961 [Glycine max]|nr:hypothetical protein JHK84_040961 [Glycine max]